MPFPEATLVPTGLDNPKMKWSDQEEGGNVSYPYPLSCSQCDRYIKHPGGPDHNYGLSRGHYAHCTCDYCF